MVRLVKVEKENATSDGDGGILSLANNIRNRVMNALPANASANKMPQDVLKSTVDVLDEVVAKGGDEKTAVTLVDDEELVVEKPLTYHKAEVQAEVQQLIVEQRRLRVREGQQNILARTDKALENQDQMQSNHTEINQTNRVMNALPANASADKVPQDVLKSTVGVFSTAVTLDELFEEFEKEVDAKTQFLDKQKKQASHNICGVQTTDASHNSIHNILRNLQRSVNRIEHRQKTLQDDLKALQVQARQSQIRHSPADIDALAEAVVAKVQTNI